MNLSTGFPTLNVTGNVTATSTEYTVLNAGAVSGSSGSTTLGTVPANRRWRIIGLAVSSGIDEESTTGDYGCIINLNGVQALGVSFRVSTATARQAAAANSVTFLPTCCPILTAGQTVTMVNGTAAQYSSGTVYYVEEVV